MSRQRRQKTRFAPALIAFVVFGGFAPKGLHHLQSVLSHAGNATSTKVILKHFAPD
jgi:hypothetical protein